MGEKGEGFTGTIIKHIWTITREGGNGGGRWEGWGWVEWWGEKAENCTLTTIKKIFFKDQELQKRKKDTPCNQ